jgi:predicted CoA-binding protein
MPDAGEVLAETESVLLIDYPGRVVPDTVARAGYQVVAHDGPGDVNYNAYEVDGDEVVARNLGVEPDHVDLVYSHRPFDELPGILELALRVGARAIWSEAGPGELGAAEARALVEAAGLAYVDEPPLVDAVRAYRGGPTGT